MIEKFAGYGFNKSHSTAYALIAYQTAYLKAHYPVEFMAALLSRRHSGPQLQEQGSAGRASGRLPSGWTSTVVPPDVNRSEVDFTVADGKILFGLSAIKGCGSGAAEAIVAARRQDGRFTSLFDFCERVDPQACGRAAIETLIKAGAFDSLGAKRSQLMAAIDRAMQSGAAVLADRKSGQHGLFDGDDDDAATTTNSVLPNVPEFRRERKAGDGEGSARLLPHQPSARRSTKRRCAPIARTPARSLPSLEASRRKCSSAACWRRSSSRTPRIRGPAARTRSTRCGTWKISTASCAASSGPSSSPSSASW